MTLPRGWRHARQPSEQDWPLRTARLSIRRATEADLEATWQFRRLPEVCEWLTLDASDKEEYTARYLSESRLSKTLIVERDGQVIGDLMLAVDDAWAQVEVAEQARSTQAELGWVIAPEHAGNGYATEAAGELLRFCFEDLGVRRVIAQCFADNVGVVEADGAAGDAPGGARAEGVARTARARGETASPTRSSPRSGSSFSRKGRAPECPRT